MKGIRVAALLIISALVLTTLFGCSGNELSYTVRDLATVSDSIGQVRTCEVPEWSYEKCTPHIDPSAPKETTVTFNGKTYTGTYEASFTRLPNTFVSHHYKVDTKDGTLVRFETNALTGELVCFSLHNKVNSDNTLDETGCRMIADGIAKDYISLKDYKVRTEAFYDNTAFAFTYYREVSGYETTDSIRIFVYADGTVTNCDVSLAGTFEKIKQLAIDDQRATAAIDGKIQEIYGQLGTMTGYTIKSSQWVVTPDGRCGRLYTVSVDFRDGSFITGSIDKLLLI